MIGNMLLLIQCDMSVHLLNVFGGVELKKKKRWSEIYFLGSLGISVVSATFSLTEQLENMFWLYTLVQD